VAGALGVDLASRVASAEQRERQSPFEPTELTVPEQTDAGEIETPEQERAPELPIPVSPLDQSELPPPTDSSTSELDVPTRDSDAPPAIRAAELIGRRQQRERNRDSEGITDREPVVPEEFLPDEEQTIGDPQPMPEEQPEEPFSDVVDRPAQGVRTFPPDQTSEPTVSLEETFQPDSQPSTDSATAAEPIIASLGTERDSAFESLGPEIDQPTGQPSAIDTDADVGADIFAGQLSDTRVNTAQAQQPLKARRGVSESLLPREEAAQAQPLEAPRLLEERAPATAAPPESSPPSESPRPRDRTPDDDDDDEPLDSAFGVVANPFSNPVETAEEFLGDSP